MSAYFDYTWFQWVFFFFFYCFFGWCFESTYVSIMEKKLTNRVFMRGPFLPLYGTGGMMMLLISAPFGKNYLLIYISGCVGATILEYLTGITMEALFKVRYWDYSHKKFNFQGHICLESTLAWGGLTLLMRLFVHPFVSGILLRIPDKILEPVTIAISVFAIVDFTLAFKAAIDLRDILIAMEKAKAEVDRMQKRADVLIALSADSVKTYTELKLEEFEKIKNNTTQTLEGFMEEAGKEWEKIRADFGEHSAAYMEELTELKTKIKLSTNNIVDNRFKERGTAYLRSVIKNNPAMVSDKFKDSLQEIKDKIRK